MNRGGRTSPDGSPEPLVATGGAPVRTGDQFTQEDYSESYNVCMTPFLVHFIICGCGPDRMVVGFTTTYAISAYHH